MFKTTALLIDVCLITLVSALGFLTFSKSLGFARYSNYVERLLGGDKVLHVLAGGILVLCAFQIQRHLLPRSTIRKIISASIFTVFILILDESLQVFSVTRVQSWSDFMFGCVGLISAIGLIGMIELVFLKRS
ncbi:VanZ family protein [Marinicellulosiphila megalodicopiae]|uniref:VanZ family protein n=1 Tax=Marinicellulosiphila megalodicopiae TaxID=2724896 RepID=UPI003BB09439